MLALRPSDCTHGPAFGSISSGIISDLVFNFPFRSLFLNWITTRAVFLRSGQKAWNQGPGRVDLALSTINPLKRKGPKIPHALLTSSPLCPRPRASLADTDGALVMRGEWFGLTTFRESGSNEEERKWCMFCTRRVFDLNASARKISSASPLVGPLHADVHLL